MTEISITAPVRLLLADDHQIFRDGLKMLLQLIPNLQLVAELDSLTELRNSVKATEPQLLLLDFHMPGGETSAEIDYLKQRYPTLKVIVLTGSQSPTVLKQLDLVQADGILQKNGDAAELKAAIDAVLSQQRYIAPRVLQLISESSVELTAREFEVLKLVCDGLSNAQIAEQMHLSPKTTDKHRENLMRKLDVNNAPQLIKKALQLGLLDSSC
jgi:DNA-binding NarL/FixJ family response regulator